MSNPLWPRLAVDAIRQAQSLLVVTGAGISAASGIPTFRGEGGLWRSYRFDQLATPEAFARDPGLVWTWYQMRRRVCLDAQPNAAHQALVTLEQRTPGFLLATQNVDGLHRRAGSNAQIALHGDILDARCTQCHHIWTLGEAECVANESEISSLPHCQSCGGLARPHILWFGEMYWPETIDVAFRYAMTADVALVIGTSGSVGPPAALIESAGQHGAMTIEVNPNASALSGVVDHAIAADAVPAMEALLDLL
jgi:NAD-dependent deacetylase